MANKIRDAARNQVKETSHLPSEKIQETIVVEKQQKRTPGRPKVDEPMIRKSYAIQESIYNEIKDFVELKGDQMATFVRRAIIEKYQLERRKGV